MNKLTEYLDKMLIVFFVQSETVIKIDGKNYLYMQPDEPMFYIMEKEEDVVFAMDKYMTDELDGSIFMMCGRFYIHNKENTDFELIEIKNIGKASVQDNTFLGIRSGYELLNGMGTYKDWIQKAKFLGVKSLGICEKHTLAGALDFQEMCLSNNIKPIIGMTFAVDNQEGGMFDIKAYAKNFQGWQNLLKINSAINVKEKPSISVDLLNSLSDDCYYIADPKSLDFKLVKRLGFKMDYFQLDPVNFLVEDKEDWYSKNLNTFIMSNIAPIMITDAFYIEQSDWEIREALWTIGKVFDEKTDNQYFKTKGESLKEFLTNFEDNDIEQGKTIFNLALKNEGIIADNCNFKYDTDTRHLPKYEMTAWESENFKTNEELFLHYVYKGLSNLSLDAEIYKERLLTEIDVLKAGDVLDYFLTKRDIMEYTRKNGMITGAGRGSAGGSLVAYVLGITQVDPVKYGLMFERFLNRGRMGEFLDRPSYIIDFEDGNIVELEEGTIIRVTRNGKEIVVYVHELKETDKFITI